MGCWFALTPVLDLTGELKVSPREEFRSKANLMTYISQHRNSLNPLTVDQYVEINFYSSITKYDFLRSVNSFKT